MGLGTIYNTNRIFEYNIQATEVYEVHGIWVGLEGLGGGGGGGYITAGAGVGCMLWRVGVLACWRKQGRRETPGVGLGVGMGVEVANGLPRYHGGRASVMVGLGVGGEQ